MARGQTLRHEFRLANPTEQPLAILGTVARVPCCSRIGSVPPLIPAGESVIVPVFLKVGQIRDDKRALFEVKVDSPTEPIRTLIVKARFVPSWEIQEAPDQPAVAQVGQADRRTYRLVARRRNGEGQRIPAEVTATAPFKIENLTTVEEIEDSSGVIESSRSVSVALPAVMEPGTNAGSILLRWSDGSSQTQSIAWTVEPKILAIPPTLLLKSEIEDVQVQLRSNGPPFRVRAVRGSLVTNQGPISDQAAVIHSLRIVLDRKGVVAGVAPEIEILTDDPDQPRLKLGVLFLPSAEGQTP